MRSASRAEYLNVWEFAYFHKRSPGWVPGLATTKWRDWGVRLFERLRLHRLLVMPKAPSKSDRRHGDDDCNGEKSAHR